MTKKILLPILCLVFSTLIKAQTIIPSETAEVCPNTEYTFLVTLPGACSNIFVFATAINIPPFVQQGPFNVSVNANATAFNFKGKFADFNNLQTFTVQYNDANNTSKTRDFTFTKVKSLANPNSYSQIYLNTYNITSPYCQVTTHNVNFANVKYDNPFANPPTLGYGTITNYEYQLPVNWKVSTPSGTVTSNGSTWIASNNNVTITSDLITGDGEYISVRASNIVCGANLAAGQVSRILISKPVPPTSIDGDIAICTNSTRNYTLINPPCNATNTWSITDAQGNPTLATVSPINGNSTTVTVPTALTAGSLLLKATMSNGLIKTFSIYIGSPTYTATYSNGRTNSLPVAIYYPNNPPYTYNNVCIGATFPNVYVEALPSGANSINWSVPSGYESNTYGIVSQSSTRAYFGWNFAAPNPPAYIQATVTNSCGSYSNIFAFQQYNCGTANDPCAFAKNQKYFTVSPNPTNGLIRIGIGNKPPPIECSFAKTFANSKQGVTFSTVNIYNNTGTLVKTVRANKSKQANINTSTLINGTYTVEIIEGDYSEKQQIIVQH